MTRAIAGCGCGGFAFPTGIGAELFGAGFSLSGFGRLEGEPVVVAGGVMAVVVAVPTGSIVIVWPDGLLPVVVVVAAAVGGAIVVAAAVFSRMSLRRRKYSAITNAMASAVKKIGRKRDLRNG
jgi:hypothetical protein